jgi:hypothetical protein
LGKDKIRCQLSIIQDNFNFRLKRFRMTYLYITSYFEINLPRFILKLILPFYEAAFDMKKYLLPLSF